MQRIDTHSSKRAQGQQVGKFNCRALLQATPRKGSNHQKDIMGTAGRERTCLNHLSHKDLGDTAHGDQGLVARVVP